MGFLCNNTIMLLFEIWIMSNWNDHHVIKSKTILTQKVGESNKTGNVGVFERDGREGEREKGRGEKRGTGREREERKKKAHIAFSDIKASIWSQFVKTFL